MYTSVCENTYRPQVRGGVCGRGGIVDHCPATGTVEVRELRDPYIGRRHRSASALRLATGLWGKRALRSAQTQIDAPSDLYMGHHRATGRAVSLGDCSAHDREKSTGHDSAALTATDTIHAQRDSARLYGSRACGARTSAIGTDRASTSGIPRVHCAGGEFGEHPTWATPSQALLTEGRCRDYVPPPTRDEIVRPLQQCREAGRNDLPRPYGRVTTRWNVKYLYLGVLPEQVDRFEVDPFMQIPDQIGKASRVWFMGEVSLN